MNRLILIGNGFDLAHGMKTSYNDFILWYITDCVKQARKIDYIDEIIEVKRTSYYDYFRFVNDHAVEGLIQKYYEESFEKILINSRSNTSHKSENSAPFKFNIKSQLLEVLLKNCSFRTWVEIETEFYELLKAILKKDATYRVKQEDLAALNKSLSFLIGKLQEYLSQLPTPTYDKRYGEIFGSLLKKFEILLPWSEGPEWRSEERYKINRTFVLNFNYTRTASLYTKDIPTLYNNEFIDIHGQLNDDSNPIIFGFGDELDENYLKMERERAKGYFRYIKSFWYFRTSNYWHLIRFIDSEEYQIYVLGHSCGLSDRTMLNMIFEHPNCMSIKIFYYGDEASNNYTEVTYEIARHFSDKALMRRRIISIDRSIRMPQFND